MKVSISTSFVTLALCIAPQMISAIPNNHHCPEPHTVTVTETVYGEMHHKPTPAPEYEVPEQWEDTEDNDWEENDRKGKDFPLSTCSAAQMIQKNYTKTMMAPHRPEEHRWEESTDEEMSGSKFEYEDLEGKGDDEEEDEWEVPKVEPSRHHSVPTAPPNEQYAHTAIWDGAYEQKHNKGAIEGGWRGRHHTKPKKHHKQKKHHVYPKHHEQKKPIHSHGLVIHPVVVGGIDRLTYSPPYVLAEPGEVIRFDFLFKNHTATQSSFKHPCSKLVGGQASGFHFNEFNEAGLETFEFVVPHKHHGGVKVPQWFYCGQGTHCKKDGMVFAVNPNKHATFEDFQARAKGLIG